MEIKSDKKVIITCALPYANFSLHLGHIYSTFLPADITARAYRYKGYDVCFFSGVDAHGTPIITESLKTQVSPEDILKTFTLEHKQNLKKMNISLDKFGTTHTNNHCLMVRKIFNRLKMQKKVFVDEEEIYYCMEHKTLTDRLLVRHCMLCNRNLIEDEIHSHSINYKCLICGQEPILKKTQEIFLQLYKTVIIQMLEYTKFNNVSKTIIHELQTKKLFCDSRKSISRDMIWGVNVPTHILKNRVFYVWFEAIIGYLSICPKKYKWNDALKIQFFGQDNLFFHTIVLSNIFDSKEWPNMIISNKFLTSGGKKFSKSERNGVFLSDIEVSQTGFLRLYLLSIFSTKDNADFSNSGYEQYKESIIKNKIANLIQRVCKLFYEFNIVNIFVLDEDQIMLNKFLNECIEANHYKSYEIFILLVEELNKTFDREKVWQHKDLSNATKWINRIYMLKTYIDILSPSLSKQLFRWLKCIDKQVYLSKCKGKLID